MKFRLSKREVAELLKEKGINPTAQRIEIAHLLYQKPQHLSAEEILNMLNAEYELVSLATVYNTLKLFAERKVVRELIFSSDRIYYDSNTTPHHHFVDIDTGRIYDIPLCIIPVPDLDRLNMGNAQILETTLILRGRLPDSGSRAQNHADHGMKTGRKSGPAMNKETDLSKNPGFHAMNSQNVDGPVC
jgi:Fur family iron response transcriptional regulator